MENNDLLKLFYQFARGYCKSEFIMTLMDKCAIEKGIITKEELEANPQHIKNEIWELVKEYKRK
jgi:hypothetical protein